MGGRARRQAIKNRYHIHSTGLSRRTTYDCRGWFDGFEPSVIELHWENGIMQPGARLLNRRFDRLVLCFQWDGMNLFA